VRTAIPSTEILNPSHPLAVFTYSLLKCGIRIRKFAPVLNQAVFLARKILARYEEFKDDSDGGIPDDVPDQ
jgi:hypothetical protein